MPPPGATSYASHHHHQRSISGSGTDALEEVTYGYEGDGMMADKGLPFDPFMSSAYMSTEADPNVPPLGLVQTSADGSLSISPIHSHSDMHINGGDPPEADEDEGPRRYYVDPPTHRTHLMADFPPLPHAHPPAPLTNGTFDMASQAHNIERILSRSASVKESIPDPTSPGMGSSSFDSDHSEKSSVDLTASSVPSTVNCSPQTPGNKGRTSSTVKTSPTIKTSLLFNGVTSGRDPSTYCAIFSSVEGIVKGVAKAAVATQGGLFGGVDYAGIRRKLGRAPPSSLFDRTLDEMDGRDARDSGSDVNGRLDDRDEFRNSDGSLQQGGGNKKKRKVPEVSMASHGGDAMRNTPDMARVRSQGGRGKDESNAGAKAGLKGKTTSLL
ncbi:hypothetical protein BT69DRAFT_483892 [Atractiella rhizophila]|nr:hypothetical protein BT69DRAFT_483892 [Atractiella rhizophila]